MVWWPSGSSPRIWFREAPRLCLIWFSEGQVPRVEYNMAWCGSRTTSVLYLIISFVGV